MPRMELMGRHYHIASDAVTVPAFCMALGRLLWSSVVLGLFLHLQYLLQGCTRPGFVDTFVGLSVALFLTTVLVELAIVAVSMRGSIVHTKARSGVGTLVVADMALGGLQLFVCALGLVILSDPGDLVSCESVSLQGRVDLIVALIAISQLADLSMKCCCCLILVGDRIGQAEAKEMDEEAAMGPRQPLHYFREHHESLHTYSHAEERWRGRCNFLCTCLRYTTCHLFSSSAGAGGGRGGPGQGDGMGGAGDMADLEVVARVMADIFHSEGFLDVLPSDIMAGFILLRHVQKAQEHEMVARGASGASSGVGAGAAMLEDAQQQQQQQQQQQLEEGAGGDTSAAASSEDNGATGDEAAAAATAAAATVEATKAAGTTTGLAASLIEDARVRLQSGHYLAKNALNPADPEERKVLEEGTYFEVYALAIYSWMMYTYARTPCVGLPLLGLRRAFRMPPGKRSQVHGEIGAVIGDNWFRAHEAGVLEFTQGRDCEVAYATFVNSLYERPYAVFVDHRWQCVVLAIRGTLSLEDLMNDAHAEPVAMDEMGKAWGFDGAGEFCHGGMLNAADCIAKDLYRHQLLQRLIHRGRGDSPPAFPHTPLTRSSKGYSLRIVGHSLGAGAAILLSFMLRRDFPELRCLAYGTPGGLLSPRLAEASRAFATSFVVGRDLVPRLSLGSVYKLRDDLLRLLARCRANKNTVLRSVLDKDSRAAVERLLHPSEEVPRSEFLEQLEAYEEQMRRVERRVTQAHLVPAGRLVHFVKSHQEAEKGWCGRTRYRQLYTPVWATPEDFREIYVSSSMALDHLPDRVLVVMEGTCRRLGIDV